MKQKVKALRYTCDACEDVFIRAEDDDDPVFGFHGVTQVHDPSGGTRADWFACCEGCIPDAVMNALARSRQ